MVQLVESIIMDLRIESVRGIPSVCVCTLARSFPFMSMLTNQLGIITAWTIIRGIDRM